MSDTDEKPSLPNWNLLAKEALDLWQSHLTSLSTDPVAKAELARMIEPMGQMFANWTSMMQKQQGAYGSQPSSQPTPEPASQPAPSTGDEPAGAPNGASSGTVSAGDASFGGQPPAPEPVRASEPEPVSGDAGPGLASEPATAEPFVSESLAPESLTPGPATAAGTDSGNSVAFAEPEPVESEPRGPELSGPEPSGQGPEILAAAEASDAPAVGDAVSPARVPDMAELAERLAELERQMDERRGIARAKRRNAS